MDPLTDKPAVADLTDEFQFAPDARQLEDQVYTGRTREGGLERWFEADRDATQGDVQQPDFGWRLRVPGILVTRLDGHDDRLELVGGDPHGLTPVEKAPSVRRQMRVELLRLEEPEAEAS